MRPRRATGAHSSGRRLRAQRSTPRRPVTAQPYATWPALVPASGWRIDAAPIRALLVDAPSAESVFMSQPPLLFSGPSLQDVQRGRSRSAPALRAAAYGPAGPRRVVAAARWARGKAEDALRVQSLRSASPQRRMKILPTC